MSGNREANDAGLACVDMTPQRSKASRSGPLTHARIGVLMGGQSAERDISLKTGQAVYAALLRRGYEAVTIDVDTSVAQRLREQKVDLAFMALHGPGGEDGTIQGLLDVMGIPYTGSGVRASAIAMHKETTKILLDSCGIPVPAGTVVRAGKRSQDMRVPPTGLKWPVVVKPASQGSTIGVTIVRAAAQWREALRRAHQHDREALVESYIPGREVTVSILSGTPLPAIEVVAPGGFYDYQAKYQKGRTHYLCPAPLPAKIGKRIRELALQTYEIVGCAGAARVDFRITPKGRPYVLEINTTPGMTETSLLPMAAARAGIDYDSLTERILGSALRRAKPA
ncbi:MAG: D-alanine--D-alanine ligase [Nitrospiraceae bacterium]